MIERIEVLGPLVSECTLPGETKADQVFPAHANGVPLSKDRWLITFSTRGYRFGDDELSAVYQIREGSPVGRVIKEGWFSRAHDQWQPLDDGVKYFRQHGHPVTFGVPKGALVNGRRVPHENIFVTKWRILGLDVHKPGNWNGWAGEWPRRNSETQDVEWIQYRLNDAGDDIEILSPARPLRQKGLEGGRICCHTPAGEPLERMNQTFVQAVPFNADCSEWADVNHFPGGRLAALKYRFNPATGLYDWVETGPLIESGSPEISLFESSLVRGDDAWIIVARKALTPQTDKGPVVEARAGREDRKFNETGGAWFRTADPFGRTEAPVYPQTPNCYNVPMTAFRCPDGIIRLFSGDASLSQPPLGRRNPLRCWEIDPHTFEASQHRVVFNALEYPGLPIRRSADKPEWTPACDFGKLLAHTGGREQYLVHRCHVNRVENAYAGVYHEKIVYSEDCAPAWSFE